jgi:hypothetical protein
VIEWKSATETVNGTAIATVQETATAHVRGDRATVRVKPAVPGTGTSLRDAARATAIVPPDGREMHAAGDLVKERVRRGTSARRPIASGSSCG